MSLNEKITENKKKIEIIKQEEEKEKIYKIYLEAYGKNGITKIIMRSMVPLINSELGRLMEDSSLFRLEVRISDKNEVEFITIMIFDNLNSVKEFAGTDYQNSYVPSKAKQLLLRHDKSSQHYEIRNENEY